MAQIIFIKNTKPAGVWLVGRIEQRKIGELDSWMINFVAVYSAKSNVPGLRVPLVWCVRGFTESKYKQMIWAFKRRLNSEMIERAEIIELWRPMELSLAVRITEFNKEIASERAEYEKSDAGNKDTAAACRTAEKAY